jgi:D-alanyl-lipoteichoic acid acyltransferase DltB (MBOAT superfamily)
LRLDQETEEKKQKVLLWSSIIFNLSILGFFKYFNFFIDSWVDLMNSIGFETENTWAFNIILPVGISFYTFQTMSYTIDIYRKNLKPTKDFIAFASFVSFFPQLVAGPIEKAHDFLPQFKVARKISLEDFKSGIFLIFFGLFKKLVIADNIAPIVDRFYANGEVESVNTTFTLIAIVLYSIQIYCDFSGYTDTAIGIAKLFGFRLMDNFNRPYFAKNPIQFWRRWHISLSTWFRDYVFIPLGGSRSTYTKTLTNVLIVFLVSGLWHGANWTFIIWGLGHFIIYAIADLSIRHLKIKIPSIISGVITFASVSILWVFFRSQSISEALTIIKNIFLFNFYEISFSLFDFGKVVILTFVLLVSDLLIERNKLPQNIFTTVFFILLLLLFGNFNSNSFIYFQF